jgi:serine/threonine-protein kinase
LLDFGSVKLQVETGAKLTALGTTLGSPCYMSPEQATGAADVDQQSDVFAVGSILYEMLTAKVAFDAPTVAMILLKILNQSPVPAHTHNPAVTPAVQAVIDRALEKDKSLRFPNARAFADAFVKALGLTGGCEAWAERPETEIASLLGRADAAKPAPAQPVQPQNAAVGPVASPAKPRQPEGRSARDPHGAAASRPTYSGTSDAPLTVPRQNGATKLLVALAIGLVLLGVGFLISR